jgi:hypothetical protein
VETGIPPASVVTADKQADASAALQLNDSWSDLTNSGVVGLNQGRAYWRTWFEDPAGIDVVVLGVGTYWHYNGVLVYPPVTSTVHYHWYDPSGWGLFQHDWQHGYNTNHSWSDAYAHFSNGSFPGCLNHHTHITFNRSKVYGYYNGDIWAYVRAIKRGLNIRTCLRALHFHHRLDHPSA